MSDGPKSLLGKIRIAWSFAPCGTCSDKGLHGLSLLFHGGSLVLVVVSFVIFIVGGKGNGGGTGSCCRFLVVWLLLFGGKQLLNGIPRKAHVLAGTRIKTQDGTLSTLSLNPGPTIGIRGITRSHGMTMKDGILMDLGIAQDLGHDRGGLTGRIVGIGLGFDGKVNAGKGLLQLSLIVVGIAYCINITMHQGHIGG